MNLGKEGNISRGTRTTDEKTVNQAGRQKAIPDGREAI